MQLSFSFPLPLSGPTTLNDLIMVSCKSGPKAADDSDKAMHNITNFIDFIYNYYIGLII